MTNEEALAASDPSESARGQRLRRASIAFHVATLLLISIPIQSALGLHKTLNHLGLEWLYDTPFILLWLWGGVTLARDPRLKLLMPFGSRSKREAIAQSQHANVVLDELDFYLRGEAFRISYQVVAALVAAVAVARLLLGIAEVKVDWGTALFLIFPFGIFWLLALPTTVLVWISHPAGAD